MENEQYIELPFNDKVIKYPFIIMEQYENYFKVALGSANMSLLYKGQEWKTQKDDPKPNYHTPDQIGEAILKKLASE